MRILVVGGGGREHAIVTALARSPQHPTIYCAPGNPGIAELATCVELGIGEVDAIAQWAARSQIDLVVVGPEEPLVAGLVDRCRALGVRAFGPTAGAAKIEGSKSFAKEVMAAAGVPTAAHEVFDQLAPALRHVRRQAAGCVVKADGLSAGKGVVVATTAEQAERAVRQLFAGATGGRVLIEERLYGREASVLALVSGEQVKMLIPARDYKSAQDGDEGPNTGGMGAYAPHPDLGPDTLAQVERHIIRPVAQELVRRGTPFRGVLYAGLMLTANGPKVIEFNARLGDPEAQVILPLLRSDIVPTLRACVEGRLDDVELQWHSGCATCVVVASPGYPATPTTSQHVHLLPASRDGVHVFHGATARPPGGELLVAGGRVISVTAVAADTASARAAAYAAARSVRFGGAWMRGDIALEERHAVRAPGSSDTASHASLVPAARPAREQVEFALHG